MKFSHLHSTKGREPYGLFVLLVQLDFTISVLYLFLLLVVLSPINAFADYQRDTFDIQRSLNEQIHSQLKVPAEVLRTKNDKDYSFTLMIRTDSQGRITSVELDSNENISNDEIYSKLVQSAKDTVWNIGYIDVKEDLVIYVPFHFIISSKDDVN